jgi:hypothetical protein
MNPKINFETCKCIKQFAFADRHNKYQFFKNKTYIYSKSFYGPTGRRQIETHDTDMILYEVFISSDISLPMLEKKFLTHFETIQLRRDKLLDQILEGL